MRAWLTFGLSCGHALVLLAILETALCLFYFVMDGISIIPYYTDAGVSMSAEEVVIILCIVVELIISIVCLWYGVIHKGQRIYLIIWVTIFAAIHVIFTILTIIFIFKYTDYVLSMLYMLFFIILIASYEIGLAIECLPHFNAMGDLQPCGKGLRFVFDYYWQHPQEAVLVALAADFYMNLEIFLERHVLRFAFSHEMIGHEADTSVAVLMEETVFRYIRMALCAFGFIIAWKQKQLWMFKWCLAYLSLLMASLIIFIYLIFAWSAENLTLTLIYYTLMVVSLLYRAGILFVCIRYTDFYERSLTRLENDNPQTIT